MTKKEFEEKIKSVVDYNIETDEEFMFCVGFFLAHFARKKFNSRKITLKEILNLVIPNGLKDFNTGIKEKLMTFFEVPNNLYYVDFNNADLEKVIGGLMEYSPQGNLKKSESYLITALSKYLQPK